MPIEECACVCMQVGSVLLNTAQANPLAPRRGLGFGFRVYRVRLRVKG
jgi:hypothetical protein